MKLEDAQPLIERNRDNIWERAARVRDRIYDDFLSISRGQQIDALVLKTNPAIYPPQVKFEFWRKRDDSLTDRCDVIVSINPKPFHRYELEFNVTISDRSRRRHIRRLQDFSKESIETLVLYLLRKGPKPRYSNIRIRRFPGQFWRPKNKIVCIRFDWITYLPAISICLAMGIFTVFFFSPSLSKYTWLITTVMFLMIAGCWRWVLRRFRLYRSSGKPLSEPRTLILVDTWQTIIFGAGPDWQLVRERLSKALEKKPTEQFHCRDEQHWAWGLDGKEERDQLVLSFKRAILFGQIYQYGEGLYIGWDAHFNIGQWVEEKVAHGLDRVTGKLTTICTVVPGLQMVTRYDLADLNCLVEWTHGQITQLVKRYVAEKKMDQEINFTILRADRDGVFSEGVRERARSESAPWKVSPEKNNTRSIWIGTRSGN